MKKISNFVKINIYIFGVLANILPIIGLLALNGINFHGLQEYQFWAWIAGAIYYIFVWTISILTWHKLHKQNISLEERVKILEDRLGDLPLN